MSRLNQTRDAQALNFGIQSTTSAKVRQAAGALSATAAGPPPTATTDSTAASVNDWAGCVVVTTTTSATWAASNTIYGTILSNTTGGNTVLTVDGWWKVSDNTSAGNPFATAQYVVLPASMPFWVMGLCSDTTTVVGTETGTSPGTELTGNGLDRQICTTFTHSAGASTGTLGVTFTYSTTGSITIGKSFIANSKTASAGSGRGNFGYFLDVLNSTTGYVVASSGDTLQVTYTITFATVP